MPTDRGTLVGTQLGPWRVAQKLSDGGQGEVYRALRVDGGFEQIVAIKVLHARALSPVAVSRFEEEQEILASLNHPSIVNLLGAGHTENGRAWLAMEFVTGKPIDTFANERALSTTERLRIFLKVCQAVAYAHRNLIVHLDLKPSNILVTPDGEPKLLDFGLARRLQAPQNGQSPGAMTAFSRPYASPEQVMPGAAVSTVSDVYSLGAVLYEILTGHTPLLLDLLSEQATLHAILEQTPLKPSAAISRTRLVSGPHGEQFEFGPAKNSAMRAASVGELRRELQGDLDNLLLVALNKEQSRRYPSVEALAEDIQRYLDGKRVRAKASSPVYVALLGARKYPIRVFAGVLLVVLAVANHLLPSFHRRGASLAQQDAAKIQDVNCHAAGEIRKTFLPALPGAAAQTLVGKLDEIEKISRCPSP
jgi:eukaryotic-like serine/threonine-protein kinase